MLSFGRERSPYREYEVTNALVHKASIPTEAVRRAARSLFDLGLEAVPMSGQLLSISVEFARDLGITVYDACYAGLARERACPLVTASPRHQSRQVGMGCRVVPVEEWRP